MKENIDKISKIWLPVKEPVNISERIILSIDISIRRQVVSRVVSFGLLNLLSVLGVIFAFYYLWGAFYSSGLAYYLSLVYLEGFSIINYWQSLVLALAESLPVISLTLLLSFCLAWVLTGFKTVSNTKILLLAGK